MLSLPSSVGAVCVCDISLWFVNNFDLKSQGSVFRDGVAASAVAVAKIGVERAHALLVGLQF